MNVKELVEEMKERKEDEKDLNMKNRKKSFLEGFINFSKKYKKEINYITTAIFFIWLSYIVYSYNGDIFEFFINFFNDILLFFEKIYNLFTDFIVKFYNDLLTFPYNLKILSVGIFKRFIVEDLSIPLIKKYWWDIVKDEIIVLYRLRLRELKKLPLALPAPIFITLSYLNSTYVMCLEITSPSIR